jgi:hypothetical protein
VTSRAFNSRTIKGSTDVSEVQISLVREIDRSFWSHYFTIDTQ